MVATIEGISLTKEFKSMKKGRFLLNFVLQKYKKIRAIDDVSIAVEKGKTLGLLGPNGSGKTTLIKLLCGLLQPTTGSVLINGKKTEEELQKIGVMLSSSMIYFRMTGYANLKYFAKLYGVKNIDKRIKELARLVDLKEEWLYDYVEHYSLGMKTKLALARALVHDPEILFLDEPTQGLDPWVSKQIREKISEMDKTIVLSSHSFLDLKETCEKIAILKEGKLVGIDSSDKLEKYFPKGGLID